MTDTCPICSTQSETCALNSRYSGLICGECLKKPMLSMCGKNIEFGSASAGGGFVSKIDDKETDPPQHFFDLVLDDQMVLCYADEHRFGGIVYNATTRTREEAERIIREAKEAAAAQEPQRSQRRRQWARELQALNEMNAARYARGCAGGQRHAETANAEAPLPGSGAAREARLMAEAWGSVGKGAR